MKKKLPLNQEIYLPEYLSGTVARSFEKEVDQRILYWANQIIFLVIPRPSCYSKFADPGVGISESCVRNEEETCF